ncbi:hypothetical protein [Cellulomonas sp. ICMP 17802]|uniref:hypothetical protein n=1 Tax=Cellulomonas sp. ICMP 17802 TaxID=3239199 RepID=UPI00351B8033
MTPEPDARDRAVHDTLVAALRPFGQVAEVRLEWSEPARTWFTVVTPHAAGAAPLTVGVEDDDLLLVTVGSTTGEIAGPTDRLEWLTPLAAAVFAGRSREAGRSGQHARIEHEDGSRETISRGPGWPGMWLAATRHAPYGPRATD